MHRNSISFPKFIWALRKPYLIIISVWIPFNWLCFKRQYPYPNFRSDSQSYIAAAISNLNVGEWPIGYSKFLRMLHFVSHLDLFTVTIQYLLICISTILFIFTLRYFIEMHKITFSVLFAFVLINPILLHLANYIMSDGLFISLSFFWITQLIWIVYRPKPLQIISHALLLSALFTVRYNALFYPLISILVFILSSRTMSFKVSGILSGLILIVLFIFYTQNENYKLTGVRQFSPFGGWQLANNALYMYRDLPATKVSKTSPELQELDSFVRHSISLEKTRDFNPSLYIKDYYIWGSSSALAAYLRYRWRNDTSTAFFVKWASMAPIYSSYGRYLISKYPVEYFSSFMLPNVNNFFHPAIVDLEYYNLGSNRLDIRSVKWFDYKELKMNYSSDNYELNVLKPYPLIIEIFNYTFLILSIVYFFFDKLNGYDRNFDFIVAIMFSFWVLNLCFSSAASSVELRYQTFQFMLCFTFAVIFIELFLRSYINCRNHLQSDRNSLG